MLRSIRVTSSVTVTLFLIFGFQTCSHQLVVLSALDFLVFDVVNDVNIYCVAAAFFTLLHVKSNIICGFNVRYMPLYRWIFFQIYWRFISLRLRAEFFICGCCVVFYLFIASRMIYCVTTCFHYVRFCLCVILLYCVMFHSNFDSFVMMRFALTNWVTFYNSYLYVSYLHTLTYFLHCVISQLLLHNSSSSPFSQLDLKSFYNKIESRGTLESRIP